MSLPWKVIWPAVGRSRPSTVLAVVVFPHPDSPTRPNVSPRLMLKVMPSTALRCWPRPKIAKPPPTS